MPLPIATSASKAKVTMEDLCGLAPVVVEAPPFPQDAAGCTGVSLKGLLGKATSGFGVLAGDTETEKIGYDELALGVLLHTGADGQLLEPAQGGPLRVVFPLGIVLQEDDDDEDGDPKPADVRDVRCLTLTT